MVSVDGVDLSRCLGIACASINYDPVCGSDGITYCKQYRVMIHLSNYVGRYPASVAIC